MKKIGIVTICDYNNYGNRLQNYALQEILKQYNCNVKTIQNDFKLNQAYKKKKVFLIRIKFILKYIKKTFIVKKTERLKFFLKFNKYINITKSVFNLMGNNNLSRYNYIIVGSDQVWNPNFGRLTEFDLLDFTDNKNKISFSASFGIDSLPEDYKKTTEYALKKFKKISVREDAGKKIIKDLTGRTDIEVLVDPTMLLSAKEWDEVAKRPKQLNKDKYILNYFLGEMSEKRKQEIEKIAKENDCEIINILDKNSPFYQTGPSEFLYLEKNAFLICTDSFHSCVFAIIYNRPFVVFDREDNTVSMNSRIETLLNKFMLQDRKYNGKLTEEQLKHNYENAYKILEKEKQKAYDFLNTALDIKENEIERK